MRIVSVNHKGLRRFLEADDASGLPAQYVGKIRNILAFIDCSGMSHQRDCSHFSDLLLLFRFIQASDLTGFHF